MHQVRGDRFELEENWIMVWHNCRHSVCHHHLYNHVVLSRGIFLLGELVQLIGALRYSRLSHASELVHVCNRHHTCWGTLDTVLVVDPHSLHGNNTFEGTQLDRDCLGCCCRSLACGNWHFCRRCIPSTAWVLNYLLLPVVLLSNHHLLDCYPPQQGLRECLCPHWDNRSNHLLHSCPSPRVRKRSNAETGGLRAGTLFSISGIQATEGILGNLGMTKSTAE